MAGLVVTVQAGIEHGMKNLYAILAIYLTVVTLECSQANYF